jgi:hypothetical protein
MNNTDIIKQVESNIDHILKNTDFSEAKGNLIKGILRGALNNQRDEMRRKVEEKRITDIGYANNHPDTLEDIRRKEGYNQALDDILESLQ